MSTSLTLEERTLYRMVVYSLLWPVLFFVGEYLRAPAQGAALAGFIWVAGAWFIAPRASRRLSLPAWIAFSAVFGLVAAGIRLVLGRVLPDV